MSFKVAIIGRPNVGKSTLFNRLVGRRLAIVDDTPGVTRDRREGAASLGDLRFTIIDTAGLEEAFDDSMEARMRAQTAMALDEADVALLLIDARAGLTPMDSHFATWLRSRGKPAILVANKCEGRLSTTAVYESYALGLGDPIPISAEHGDGMAELYTALQPYADISRPPVDKEPLPDAPETGELVDPSDETLEDMPLQLAIVGRPNVGKSTLVNRLLGEDRMLTGPEAGITRDSISISWSFKGRAIRLIDTAGLRRRARVSEKLENLSVTDTLRAIRFAHCVVLLIDATAPLEKQDLTIARTVIEEGRALLLAVNKWDVAPNHDQVLRAIRDRLETSLPQVKGIPVVPLSALTGAHIDRLLPTVLRLYDVWNRRISTGHLNRWLAEACEQHPPPMARGRRLRLRYITQVKARPPTFVVFANMPHEVSESYLRYLGNELRNAFDLPGVPLRLKARGGNNPYTSES